MMERFKDFLNTFDFDQLTRFFEEGTWKELLNNGYAIGAGIFFLIFIAVPKTRDMATKLLVYALVIGVYGTGAVVLKNSVISQIGPFLLALTLGLGAIGFAVWQNLLKK